MPTPWKRLSLALALAATVSPVVLGTQLLAQTGSAPPPTPAAAPQATPAAPQAPPDTEIYVADLSHEGGRWRVERPRNVTKRAGYDNQPWFLPDGQRLLYTSQRGTQTDIYELDLDSARERQVTATSESEYSPQLAFDGASIVVVRVEPDTTQRLWRFPLARGGAPTVVAPEVKGVGYQAWLDPRTVAVFVLGEPFTLQLVALDENGAGAAKVLANGIGRSIHRVPGTRKVSFVASEGDVRSIFIYDPATGASQKLAPAPPTEEGDYAWAPDGALLAAVGSTLHRLEPGAGAAWIPLTDLSSEGVGKITRLAVSPLGDKIAFVAER